MANWMVANEVAGTTNAEAERAAIPLEWACGTFHGAQEDGQGAWCGINRSTLCLH